MAIALALGLSGCASTTASLSQAASDAASAVSTAELAMRQQAHDRTFITTTRTALSDAITALSGAEASANRLEAATAIERKAQASTLSAIREGTDAVLKAQRVVGSHAAVGVPALAESAHHLHAITRTLEKAAQ